MAFFEILNVFNYIFKYISSLKFYLLKYIPCSNNTLEHLKMLKKLFWAKQYFLVELQANAFVKNEFIKLKNKFFDCLSIAYLKMLPCSDLWASKNASFLRRVRDLQTEFFRENKNNFIFCDLEGVSIWNFYHKILTWNFPLK